MRKEDVLDTPIKKKITVLNFMQLYNQCYRHEDLSLEVH